jgi:hypothetical protein
VESRAARLVPRPSRCRPCSARGRAGSATGRTCRCRCASVRRYSTCLARGGRASASRRASGPIGSHRPRPHRAFLRWAARVPPSPSLARSRTLSTSLRGLAAPPLCGGRELAPAADPTTVRHAPLLRGTCGPARFNLSQGCHNASTPLVRSWWSSHEPSHHATSHARGLQWVRFHTPQRPQQPSLLFHARARLRAPAHDAGGERYRQDKAGERADRQCQRQRSACQQAAAVRHWRGGAGSGHRRAGVVDVLRRAPARSSGSALMKLLPARALSKHLHAPTQFRRRENTSEQARP